VRALAVVCAAFAVILMIVAIAGMVSGRPSDKAGGVIRALALAFFVAAVVLNVASR
jgi:hypothetical protein